MTVLSAALLTGCGAPAAQTTATAGTAIQDTGFLTLSVNPEIRVEYDEKGLVVGLSGQNDDGRAIVASYQDYIGKECDDVLRDLIVKINEAGYFVEDIDGGRKNIVIQIEPGSVIPDDRFLEEVSASTREAVKNLRLSSGIVTIDDDDYDPDYARNGSPSPYITLEKAKEIALTHAGVNAANAVFDDREFDHDDGKAVFELEFTANGKEYEYDIDALHGIILHAEHDGMTDYDDTDYNDTDYGPGSDGVTDYDDTDYGPNNDGVTDYDDTDYGPNNDGVTDYDDTDYGPNNDGVTDYDDTDYGPNNDGVTDYDDTDYGPNNDGVTDYNDDWHEELTDDWDDNHDDDWDDDWHEELTDDWDDNWDDDWDDDDDDWGDDDDDDWDDDDD